MYFQMDRQLKSVPAFTSPGSVSNPVTITRGTVPDEACPPPVTGPFSKLPARAAMEPPSVCTSLAAVQPAGPS